eukprot:symbB.v1.2.036269.t1/scaffold5081.1/size31135/3
MRHSELLERSETLSLHTRRAGPVSDIFDTWSAKQHPLTAQLQELPLCKVRRWSSFFEESDTSDSESSLTSQFLKDLYKWHSHGTSTQQCFTRRSCDELMLLRLLLHFSTVLAANNTYPDCVERGLVYRHAGAHGIFLDLSFFGSTGCWQNDCRNTDKFHSEDQSVCARACWQMEDCTHWSFGDGSCFLRKSAAGLESSKNFVSAEKGCAPSPLPDAWLARQVSKLPALACEDTCDMVRVANTWRFAIAALRRVGMMDQQVKIVVQQIAEDTQGFLRNRHEETFLQVVSNNRMVFDTVDSWLAVQPAPKQLIWALPQPINGDLCGPSASSKEETSDRERLLDVKQEAMRSRAKSSRVEELSVWVKNESKTALTISSRANRVAMGALLFTLLGVALDVTSNIITVFTTKRDMAEVEDEAAQVFAQSRQRSEAPRSESV